MFGPQLSSHSSSAKQSKGLNPSLEVLIAWPRGGDGTTRIQRGNLRFSSLHETFFSSKIGTWCDKVLANASKDPTRKWKLGVRSDTKANRWVCCNSAFVLSTAAAEVMLSNLENSANAQE